MIEDIKDLFSRVSPSYLWLIINQDRDRGECNSQVKSVSGFLR